MIKNLVCAAVLMALSFVSMAQEKATKELTTKIFSDKRLDTIQARALRLLTGFAAGTSYGEIWIRDFNTFINGSLHIHPKEKVKDILLYFFRFQGKDGNIVDGYIPDAKADKSYMPDRFIYSDLAPGFAAHKNTVETDQESSLIQAIRKYVDATGDRSILSATIDGRTVIERMEMALDFIMKERWSSKHGLVIGATTVDWGDVQPDTTSIGVEINKQTKWAIDVYDNAMFYMALNDFMNMATGEFKPKKNWNKISVQLKTNIRKYLWQQDRQKYVPHIYLDGSPFSDSFNEDALLYSGGSACAVLAGLNTKDEIKNINQQLVKAAAKEKHATIGITVYPPYPLKEFPNMAPYVYQNAGDWTWFGGRFIMALIKYDLVEEAYTELEPMIERVLKNKGFFEWYDVRTGAPKGSGDFRGEAGVLFDVITDLKSWASQQNKKS
jgi:glycogen debranching enzyme